MKQIIAKIVFVFNLAVATLLLLVYLARFSPPQYFWPLSVLALAFPYLLIANSAMLVYWIFQRSVRLILPFLVLLLGIPQIGVSFKFFPSSDKVSAGMKILTYNVHSFRYDLHAHRGNTPQVLTYFKSVNPDILCIQEATLIKNGKLSPQGIIDALPSIGFYHQAATSTYSGSITYSRYPIVGKGEIRFEGSSNIVLFSDLKLPGNKIIRVYNCHLQSYSIDPDEYSIIEDPGFTPNGQQIREARRISVKLKSGFKLREGQARKLTQHIANSPYPVIVCGDFNDTPVSYTYYKVASNLKDAFIESGWGFSNTYNGKLPSAFRIDYILYSPKFVSCGYQRDLVNYSDHYPVHAVVGVNP